MKIAMYYSTEAEQCYFEKQAVSLRKRNGIGIKLYSNCDDIIYDMENRQHFDIIVFGTEYPEVSYVFGIRVRQIINQIVLVCVSRNTEFAPKAFELGIFRYVILDQKYGLTDALAVSITEAERKNKRHYVIATKCLWVKIPCEDIRYCYRCGKMSVIVTEQGEYKERIPLYRLYDRLKKLSDAFIMIERGEIISMSKIKRIEKGEVYLEGDIALPVGRTYSSVLKGFAGDWICTGFSSSNLV